jgi:hypothetical protein
MLPGSKTLPRLYPVQPPKIQRTRTVKHEFKIKIKVPEGVSVPAMQEFILDAVSRWGKQYDPTDPRFKIGDTQIEITRIWMTKKAKGKCKNPNCIHTTGPLMRIRPECPDLNPDGSKRRKTK